jgi:hypothetical protein
VDPYMERVVWALEERNERGMEINPLTPNDL